MTKKQNIIVDGSEGVRVEKTVSTNPDLNLNNWGYGGGDIIGSVELYTNEGTYILQGINSTKTSPLLNS